MSNVLLMPAQPRYFDYGARIHTLRDRWFIAGLKGFLDRECGKHWHAVLIRKNGKGVFQPAHHWLPWVPDGERQEWLRDCVVALNVEVHWHGAWVGAWLDPNHWKFLWLDKDGDLQLTFEGNRPWERVKREGLDNIVGQGDEAIRKWIEIMQALELREDQMIKAAQGQRHP